MTDYTKLVEALRLIGKEQDCNECEAGKWHRDINCCLFEDAAAAIEELQAQVPKRGEWLNVTDSYHWYGKCSVCGKELVIDSYYAGEMNYCPNCGAKMEVQDGE